MSSERKQFKPVPSVLDKAPEVDLVMKSIQLAWTSEKGEERLAHMLQAAVYAIRENTAKLEEIRKVLASYD
jgi:hypothetical protein